MALGTKLRKLFSSQGPGLLFQALRYQYWHRRNQWIYLKNGLALENECVGDFMPHDIYWAHRSIYRFALEQLPAGEQIRVLDIGCGVGYGTAMLARHPRVASATGLDLDPHCIRYAQRHFGHTEGLDFATCAAEDVPDLHPGPYDFIFSSNVFEHLDDAGALIDQLPAQINKGGAFFFAVPPIFDEAERARQNAVEFHRSNHLASEWQEHVERAFGQRGTFFAHRYAPGLQGRPYDATSAPVPSRNLDESDFRFEACEPEPAEAGDSLTAIWLLSAP